MDFGYATALLGDLPSLIAIIVICVVACVWHVAQSDVLCTSYDEIERTTTAILLELILN